MTDIRCIWREHGIRPGGIPAAPWNDGALVGFDQGRAMVVTSSGDIRPCDLSDVLVPNQARRPGVTV